MTNSLEVPTPDLAAAAASAERRAAGLPTGALGDLAVAVDALAALNRTAPRHPHLTAFVAEHDVTANRITLIDPDQTARRATDLAEGRGALGELAAAGGVSVSVPDVGAGTPTPAIDRHDALTMSAVATAIQAGRDEADRRIDAGTDLLIGMLCGVGADVGATAIASLLTGVEPVEAGGRDGGLDDDGWSRRVATIRDARFRLTVGKPDAATLLQVAGGADLAALTGLVLQAALRGVPVLVDDICGAVAGVLAHRFAPGAEHYVLAPSTADGTLHARLLGLLNVQPLFATSLGSGPGMASLIAVSLLRAAVTAVDAAPEERDDLAPWTVDEWATDLL